MEARKHRPKKPKPPFMQQFEKRTYNPSVEGYGDPEEWREAFYQRMGIEEATEVLNKKDPRSVLGIKLTATWVEVRAAFRIKAMLLHPDRAHLNNLTIEAATEAFKTLNAAYTLLMKQYGQ